MAKNLSQMLDISITLFRIILLTSQQKRSSVINLFIVVG